MTNLNLKTFGFAGIMFFCLTFRADAASWVRLANLAPAGAGTMLQLSDGTVMIQNGSTAGWMKLKPDLHGSYVNGTWSKLAPMSIRRLYFTSDVLPSGTVWVLGGEYTGAKLDANWSPTAEIYDPVTDTWSAAAAYPDQAGCPTVTVTINGDLTNGSNQVTSLSPSTARILAQWSVTGTGIPGSTTVMNIDSNSQILLSSNATVTIAGVTLQFSGVPAACFGDVPSSALSGGRILAGNLGNASTFIYDALSDTWNPAGSKIFDRSDEEGWVKLPNGNIFTYDIFKSVATGGGYAEMYNPRTNTWSSISTSDGSANGTIPVLSSNALGSEFGPMLRLQDGRILVIGGTEHTAFYTPSTNTWSAGPDVMGQLSGNPAPFGADDASAAIMPNGHVLLSADAGPASSTSSGNTNDGMDIITAIPTTNTLQAGWKVIQANGLSDVIPPDTTITSVDSATQIHISSPASGTASNLDLTFGGVFSHPTQLFDFSPRTNTISPVSPAIPDLNLPNISSYETRMLVVPTGQVLFSDSTAQLWIYTPDGMAVPSLRPVVNQVTYQGGGVFTLRGKQLNGQSAGASYGDDVQNDENYPIIRLVNSIGEVYYCRTTNWSSADVAGGSTPQTVNFSLNPSMHAGAYLLIVSGAGISSFPVGVNITDREVNSQ